MSKLCTRLTIFLLAAASLSFQASAAWNCEDLVRAGLTQAQANALSSTDPQHYDIQVVNLSVDGIPRTIVVLGESHLKDARAEDDGANVSKTFELRGFEGGDFQKTWGGRLFDMYLTLAFEFHRLIKPSKDRPSTIEHAQNSALARELVFSLHKQVVEGRLSQEIVNDSKISVGGREYSFPELAKLYGINQADQTIGSSRFNINSPILVELESGHRPSLAENIHSVALPSGGIVLLAAFASGVWSWLDPGSVTAGYLKTTSQTIVAIGGNLLLIAYVGGRFVRGRPGFQWLDRLDYALVDGRNTTMTANILSALREHPEMSQMLVIVGRKHVANLVENLNRHQ